MPYTTKKLKLMRLRYKLGLKIQQNIGTIGIFLFIQDQFFGERKLGSEGGDQRS